MAQSGFTLSTLFRYGSLLVFLTPSFAQAQSSAPAVADVDAASWKTVVPDILQDQKTIYFEYPKSLIHGHHWIPVAVFLASAGTLIALDQYESPYFRRTTTCHGFNNAFSGTNTSLIIAGVPAATYIAGWLSKNPYAQSTAWRTGEAIADAEIAGEILKLTTQRARPRNITPRGNFADNWGDSPSISDGSFPSGHTVAAFSVATIMSERYGQNHRWVPYVAYGVAGTIGFSRVTLSAHNVSDVFVGATLGYAISRFVVLGHHHLR